MNNQLLHSEVLMADEISDHDTPYGVLTSKRNTINLTVNMLETKKNSTCMTILLISGCFLPEQYLALIILMMR